MKNFILISLLYLVTTTGCTTTGVSRTTAEQDESFNFVAKSGCYALTQGHYVLDTFVLHKEGTFEEEVTHSNDESCKNIIEVMHFGGTYQVLSPLNLPKQLHLVTTTIAKNQQAPTAYSRILDLTINSKTKDLIFINKIIFNTKAIE